MKLDRLSNTTIEMCIPTDRSQSIKRSDRRYVMTNKALAVDQMHTDAGCQKDYMRLRFLPPQLFSHRKCTRHMA